MILPLLIIMQFFPHSTFPEVTRCLYNVKCLHVVSAPVPGSAAWESHCPVAEGTVGIY